MRLVKINKSRRIIVAAALWLLAVCSLLRVLAKDSQSPETLLLKDYRPKSVYKMPRTVIEKAKYPAIEMHAHDYAKTAQDVARWLKRHPKTTFIACHFANCSYDLARLGELFDKYPNLYADISARYAETAAIPRFTGKFYEKYQDRLVYGTDMGNSAQMYRLTFRILESADEHFYAWSQFSDHGPPYGLDLTDAILDKVYWANALKILRD